jgi:hypothetical protein
MPQFPPGAASVTALGGHLAMVAVTQADKGTMTQSARKLAGTVLILLLILVYSIGAMAIYANFLGGAAWWILILYFAVAGALWFFPASWIIRWMARPD